MQSKQKYLNFLLRFLASGFFISYIPASILKNRKHTSAGLWGTLLGLLFLLILPSDKLYYLLFLTAATAISIPIAGNVSFNGHKHDDPKIILDEVIGFWFAAAFLPRTVIVLAASFVLFRFFDTVKPFFIKKLDNLKGGTAVVGDDVASGIITNLIMQIALILIQY